MSQSTLQVLLCSDVPHQRYLAVPLTRDFHLVGYGGSRPRGLPVARLGIDARVITVHQLLGNRAEFVAADSNLCGCLTLPGQDPPLRPTGPTAGCWPAHSESP